MEVVDIIVHELQLLGLFAFAAIFFQPFTTPFHTSIPTESDLVMISAVLFYMLCTFYSKFSDDAFYGDTATLLTHLIRFGFNLGVFLAVLCKSYLICQLDCEEAPFVGCEMDELSSPAKVLIYLDSLALAAAATRSWLSGIQFLYRNCAIFLFEGLDGYAAAGAGAN